METVKKVKVRSDLLSKSDYAKRYNKSRPTIDKMIESGQLEVEEISGVDYIKIEKK